MFSNFLLIYLVYSVSADAGTNAEIEIMPKCSDSPGTRMTFTPEEGYRGRYTAELCTETKWAQTRKKWGVVLEFYDSPRNCNKRGKKSAFGTTHSTNVDWVSNKHNCSDNQTVCMSVQFDLIFSACYSISSNFTKDTRYYYFNISNAFLEKDFVENQPDISVKMNNDYVSVMWYPGIPPSLYSVDLCNQTDLESCESVGNCSTVQGMSIKCYLDPRPGCYKIFLKHHGTWTSGHFYKQDTMHHNFCRNSTSPAAVRGGSAWRWAGAGAGALLAGVVLAGAARALCRALQATKRQKEVLRKWLVSESSSGAAGAEAGRGGARHVLLLHAREGPLGDRVVAALKEALQHVIDGQVYDLYSPVSVALGAGAPGAWLRGLLARADVRVLLLQSPALQALYQTQLRDSDLGITVSGGLLGRRVVPRSPHPGDALLALALRLASEDPRARADYRKYYVATISQLEAECVPQLVPFRRYVLPGAGPLLLQELGAPPSPPSLLARLEQALAELADHARAHPDYLMDELVLIDD